DDAGAVGSGLVVPTSVPPRLEPFPFDHQAGEGLHIIVRADEYAIGRPKGVVYEVTVTGDLGERVHGVVLLDEVLTPESVVVTALQLVKIAPSSWGKVYPLALYVLDCIQVAVDDHGAIRV